MEQFKSATEEIAARIETLRNKAGNCRGAAEEYADLASNSRRAAQQADDMADQYQAIIDGAP